MALCITFISGRLYNVKFCCCFFLSREFVYVKSNAPISSRFVSDCIVFANRVLIMLLRSLEGVYLEDSLYEGGMNFGQNGSYFQSRSETRLNLSKPSGKGLNSFLSL